MRSKRKYQRVLIWLIVIKELINGKRALSLDNISKPSGRLICPRKVLVVGSPV
jgi:hypothetical protein